MSSRVYAVNVKLQSTNPKIDIDLTQGSKDDGERRQELRTILSISLQDKRNIIEQRVPGSSGNVLQDLGPSPVIISLEGEIYGSEASSTVEDIYKIYDAGKPIEFHSDLAAIAEVNKAFITKLQINKSQDSEMYYSYSMELRESS